MIALPPEWPCHWRCEQQRLLKVRRRLPIQTSMAKSYTPHLPGSVVPASASAQINKIGSKAVHYYLPLPLTA